MLVNKTQRDAKFCCFLFEKEGELLFNFAIKRLVKSGPTTSSSETLEQRSYEFSILESEKEKKRVQTDRRRREFLLIQSSVDTNIQK